MKKGYNENMKCKICKNKIKSQSNKFCSQQCYWKSLIGKKGKDTPNYRENVGKSQVHKWLKLYFGKAKVCESKECNKKSNFFEWALIDGKEYERNRKNFMRLCRSCHRKYDLTPKKRRLAIINLKKFNPYYGTETRNKVSDKQASKLQDIYEKVTL